MDSATEKLELGLQRLAKAGDDADMLGLALQSIHGALEDHFRARLLIDSHVPADQRAAMADPKQTQWKDLLDAMQLYGDLSAPDRELIWRANGLRTKVAHGGRYTGSRADLERYAALVQTLCGYVPPAKPAVPRQARPPAEKPVAKLALPQDIPRAVRGGAPAPPARSRSRWPGGVLAMVLLIVLAGVVVLRSVTSPRAESAAAATAPATEAPAAAAESRRMEGPPTSAPPTPLPRAATVTAQDGLNLRVDHGSAARVIGTLPSGTRVTILGAPVQADGYAWWNVEVDGRRGWCAGEFLAFD